jgi:hypothetical protein
MACGCALSGVPARRESRGGNGVACVQHNVACGRHAGIKSLAGAAGLRRSGLPLPAEMRQMRDLDMSEDGTSANCKPTRSGSVPAGMEEEKGQERTGPFTGDEHRGDGFLDYIDKASSRRLSMIDLAIIVAALVGAIWVHGIDANATDPGIDPRYTASTSKEEPAVERYERADEEREDW